MAGSVASARPLHGTLARRTVGKDDHGTPLNMPPALIAQLVGDYITAATFSPQADDVLRAIIAALGEITVLSARIYPTEPRTACIVVEADDTATLTRMIPGAVRVTRTPQYAVFRLSGHGGDGARSGGAANAGGTRRSGS